MYRHYGMVRQVPNALSEHRTVTSLMLDTHWATQGLIDRWGWERFVRLANFLEMTPWELASLAMIRHEVLGNFKLKGVLRIPNMRATALVLTLIEAAAMNGWTDDIIRNPWPSLSGLAGQRPKRSYVKRKQGTK